jgi:catechol 2,3-dioxygenase-like lactoylglutathione lyase family enzyme
MKTTSFLSTLAIVATSHAAVIETAAANPVTFRAIGLGVTSRTAATAWYTKTLGLQKLTTMKLAKSKSTPWDEDINFFTGAKGSSMVIMEWKERPSRSVKNLPLKLTFAVKDPTATHALITANGGKAVNITGAPGALYAKDPDGYLMELVRSTTGQTDLLAVGVGVADLSKTAKWWSQTTGLEAGQMQKSSLWSSISLKGPSGSELVFMDWNESPKRPTSNLPIKIVMLAKNTNTYTSAIKQGGGKVKSNMRIVAFAEDPFE